MKKTTLLTLFVLSIILTNAQTEFAPIGAEWCYNFDDTCLLNHVVSEKDTTVEGSACRVIRHRVYLYNSIFESETYIIKQEQGKVYYYYQDQFHLLFDFDAKVNDTIVTTFMYKRYNFYTGHPPTDTILSVRYLVEEITINAHNLKVFKTKGIDEIEYGNDYYKPYSPPYIYKYTEKIGYSVVFMPMFHNGGYPDKWFDYWLRCYSDADISFVSNKWGATSLPCGYPVMDINTLNNENIKIYPNPTTGELRIENGELRIKSVEIFDVYGRNLLLHTANLTPHTVFDISHLPAGIYFVKIQNKDNSIQTFKIVRS